MELQQLRYLIAVAETENFTRASERCHVAQPSLSQQIINLEREIGHKLFHRLGRRAVPTEAGQVFLHRARRILLEVDDAEREMRDSGQIDRSITIGSIPTLAPTLLPQLLALCKTQFPQLEVQAREDFRDELIEGVLDGKLDLAIIAMPVPDPRLTSENLFSEPLLLAVGKNHPLASKQYVTSEDIGNERFVMMGSRSTLANEIRRFCGDEHIEPQIAYHCAQIATVKSLVSQGFGITILPKGTITPEDRTRIICKQLAERAPTRDIGVIRHQLRYQSRGAEQFLSALRAHVGASTTQTL